MAVAKTVIIKDKIIYLPLKAHVFMQSPQFFLLKSADEGCLDIYLNVDTAKANARLTEHTKEYAIYNIFGMETTGEFHLVNYHPHWYLMPKKECWCREDEEKSSTSDTWWTQIKDYHEHRSYHLQDLTANERSKWLAEDILLPLLGTERTLLELGCGSGRNLYYIHQLIKDAKTYGFDINPIAISSARELLKGLNSECSCRNIYELSDIPDGFAAVVFTSGVLMHIPHKQVRALVREMHRITQLAVVHFELHGCANDFDYHRYPRDYETLYLEMGFLGEMTYQLFPIEDSACGHALCIAKKAAFSTCH